jgi:hypothetical protein
VTRAAAAPSGADTRTHARDGAAAMAAHAWARRCGLPAGLLSRQMLVMCLFNLLLHAKPSEPHLARPHARTHTLFTPRPEP